jgi:hypothetical protein
MQPIFNPDRRRDILLLVFNVSGILFLTGAGIYLLIKDFSSSNMNLRIGYASSLFGATGLFLCAGLLLPLLHYGIRQFKGREIRQANLPPVKFWQMAGLTGIWVTMLILGSFLNSLPKYASLTALPFYLLGIALPVAGLVWIAIGGLPAGSWRRVWAAFSMGMTGSTLAALFLEISIVGIAALAAGIIAMSNPTWMAIFQQIRRQVTNAGDVQTLLTVLGPYLTNPLILLAALVFAAVLAPIIEESLKPAAVWWLGKRLHSPAEGFALGALCGAGFALLEGTLAASESFQMLGSGLAARAAGSLLHITTSAVMGWGIASSRLEKRNGRLAWAYFLAISIHGLWNGSVILAAFGSLRLALPGAGSDLPSQLLAVAGIVILTLTLVTIIIMLPIINHRLRPLSPDAEPSLQSDIIAPPQP